MRRQIVLAFALGLVALGLMIASAVFYFEKPATVRVAVSRADPEDADLMAAAGKLLKHGHKPLRLKIVDVDGVQAAAAALDAGTADLSVVRADEAMPTKGDTVVVLHHDAGLLMAPAGSDIAKIGDLDGKRVGTLSGGAGDDRLLETALGQYDVDPAAVKLVRLTPATLQEAVAAKSVDAVFVVGQVSDGIVPATVKAVAKAGGGPPVFLPVAEAAAIAQRSPAYESVEIVRGAFGGTPPRPADEFDTLSVTYRLVASADVDQSVISTLTEFLLTQRVALAQIAPSARHIEAPPTDKGAAIPVHPGTAAYIDDDEETFLDRYSDFIYIGAMVLGVVASGLTAIVGRFGPRSAVRPEDLVARLLQIIKETRSAPTAAALDLLEDEVDDIVASALDEACLRSLDERRVSAINMAVEQVRAAIRDRRDILRRSLHLPANDEAALSAVASVRPFKAALGDRTISDV